MALNQETSPLEDLLLDLVAFGIGYGQNQGPFAARNSEEALTAVRAKAERIHGMFASTTTDRAARPLYSLRIAIRNALADVADSNYARFLPFIADELPEKASPEELAFLKRQRTDRYVQISGNTLAKRFFLSMIDQGWDFQRSEALALAEPIPPEKEPWFKNTGQPTVEACPKCGSAEVIRLREGYEAAPSVPIVGCGNEWHYVFPKPPYDNPAMQHHPDDGHKHEFSCARCGVNPLEREICGNISILGGKVCFLDPDHPIPIHTSGDGTTWKWNKPDGGQTIEPARFSVEAVPVEFSENEAIQSDAFAPVYEGARAALTGSFAPSTWPAEVLAKAMSPHPFEGSGWNCALRACNQAFRASVHQVVEPEADPGWPPQDGGG